MKTLLFLLLFLGIAGSGWCADATSIVSAIQQDTALYTSKEDKITVYEKGREDAIARREELKKKETLTKAEEEELKRLRYIIMGCCMKMRYLKEK